MFDKLIDVKIVYLNELKHPRFWRFLFVAIV